LETNLDGEQRHLGGHGQVEGVVGEVGVAAAVHRGDALHLAVAQRRLAVPHDAQKVLKSQTTIFIFNLVYFSTSKLITKLIHTVVWACI
jgi:hypothetical protein